MLKRKFFVVIKLLVIVSSINRPLPLTLRNCFAMQTVINTLQCARACVWSVSSHFSQLPYMCHIVDAAHHVVY